MLFLASPFTRERFGYQESEVYFLALFFALFIFSGIVNSFCARSERMRLLHGLGRNPAFLFIMCITVCVQVMMIYFGGSLFRTTPVEVTDLLCIIGFSLTIIPFDFLRRLFYRLRRKT
jgi:magnesium-transporting ATPase (P-type)